MISGAPQRSELGPLSLVIYINYSDVNICDKVCRFADGTKLSGIIVIGG